jgi:hypothetical protein
VSGQLFDKCKFKQARESHRFAGLFIDRRENEKRTQSIGENTKRITLPFNDPYPLIVVGDSTALVRMFVDAARKAQ